MALKTAVVGAGVVSDRHLSGLEKCPHTELLAVCDVDEERARDAANRYGIDFVLSVEDLLLAHELDWVHVCTPVQTHLSIARTIVEEGIPVHIEKPIVETDEDAAELEGLKDEHGVAVTATHQHRFDPAIRKVQSLIDDGTLGEIRGVDVQYVGETPPDYVQRGSWVMELVGGEFEEGLPHPLYILLGVAGYPRSEDAIETTTSLHDEYEGEFTYDGAQVTYVTDDDAIASVKMLAGSTPQRRLHVYGDDMAVTADLISQTVTRIKHNFDGSSVAKARNAISRSTDQLRGMAKNVGRVAYRQVNSSWETERNLGPHYYQFDAEAKALLADDPMPIPFEEAKWTITLLEHIREASAVPQTIGVELDD